MSNLGRYQEIVTQAKAAGGVDELIKIIETNAANSKRARFVTIGLAGGLVLGVAGTTKGKEYLDRRRAEKEAAEQAKAELIARTEAADARDPGHPDPEDDRG